MGQWTKTSLLVLWTAGLTGCVQQADLGRATTGGIGDTLMAVVDQLPFDVFDPAKESRLPLSNDEIQQRTMAEQLVRPKRTSDGEELLVALNLLIADSVDEAQRAHAAGEEKEYYESLRRAYDNSPTGLLIALHTHIREDMLLMDNFMPINMRITGADLYRLEVMGHLAHSKALDRSDKVAEAVELMLRIDENAIVMDSALQEMVFRVNAYKHALLMTTATVAQPAKLLSVEQTLKDLAGRVAKLAGQRQRHSTMLTNAVGGAVPKRMREPQLAPGIETPGPDPALGA
ncbi:MAG: hypothetical protein KUG61_07005 [Parvibaculaceae bacterium]|nr:hypothetical protein [Parvibaculaceae bacterium]